MNLTTRTKYGTRFLLDIALHAQNGPVPAKDTAAREGISLKYLEKIIKALNDAGYVKGKRGPNGGNSLLKAPEEINIGQVAKVLDGFEKQLPDCDRAGACGRASKCLRCTLWDAAGMAMFNVLSSYTLADLMQDARLCPLGSDPFPKREK